MVSTGEIITSNALNSSQLSRPAYTVADQMNVLDSLHQLTHNRNLVFGPGNYEQEFIGCLSHCLLQLSEDIESSQNKKRTTWHVETPSVTGSDGDVDMGLQVGNYISLGLHKQGRIHGYLNRVRLGRGNNESLRASKQQNTR